MLVAHNELGHEPVDGKDYDGKPVRNCPLYPGVTCREHCDAAVDIDNARIPGLTRVPFLELCPNTWLVPPTGEPQQVPEEEQFVAAKVQARVRTLRKALGAALGREAFEQIRNALGQADAAIEDEGWSKALRALEGIAVQAKTPHASLRTLVQARVGEIEEQVGWAFEDLREGDEPLAQRLEAAAALVQALDVEVFGTKPPLRAAVEAWIAQQAGTTKR